MFKKSDEEDSYRERVYTKIKKVTQKTTRKNDYTQVKDKCGFDKRDNYNKGSEGHKIPHVTEEKEKAIREAFIHFGML